MAIIGEATTTVDALPESLEGPLPSCSSTPGALDSAVVSNCDGDAGDNEPILLAEIPFDLKCVKHGLYQHKGPNSYMHDTAVVLDDLAAAVSHGDHSTQAWPTVTALYAVFDGHGRDDRGSHASQFAADRIVKCLANSKHFPTNMGAALTDAILSIEHEYWAAYKSNPAATGGTTALVTVVWGSTLYVANTGDCRAVLSRQGNDNTLTRDHRPEDPKEELRILRAGGYISCGGRVGGVYAVSRVIGDFQHGDKFKGDPTAGVAWPLTAEPEITEHKLNNEDEFLIIASDGFWDVMPSWCVQYKRPPAVPFARNKLQDHNDPQECAQQLAERALYNYNTWDNVTVIVVCFGENPPKNVSALVECSCHNTVGQETFEVACQELARVSTETHPVPGTVEQ